MARVWNYSKYSLWGNFIPQDADDLRKAVKASLMATGEQPSLLRAFSGSRAGVVIVPYETRVNRIAVNL